MQLLPRTPAERLLCSALLALACHLGLLLLLDALPPAAVGQVGLTVSLRTNPGPAAPVVPAAAPPAAALAAAPTAAAPLPAASPAPQATAAASEAAAPALSLARFFKASELDVLAAPLHAIILPETEDLPPDVRLQVYIDASGQVVEVSVPDSVPAEYAESLRQRFYAARFVPARKAGMAVASVKEIALDAEDL